MSGILFFIFASCHPLSVFMYMCEWQSIDTVTIILIQPVHKLECTNVDTNVMTNRIQEYVNIDSNKA